MLDKLVDVAKAAGSLAASRRTERRANWDRVADHLELIAAALDDAAAAIRAGEVPYRQYAALQRFAATFEDVALDALRNVAVAHRDMGDYQRALDFLENALSRTSETHVERVLALLGELGLTRESLGDYELARDYAERALKRTR